MELKKKFLIGILFNLLGLTPTVYSQDRVIISGPDKQELYVPEPDEVIYEGPPVQQEVKQLSVFATQALSLMSGCVQRDFSGKSGAAVVELDGLFVVIPIKPKNLPPLPSDVDGKRTIQGIDTDSDCIRDDIIHYIYNRFPSKADANIRSNFSSYSIMLGFSLLDGLSRSTAQKIHIEKSTLFSCLENGNTNLDIYHEITELEAAFFNTFPRLRKEIANSSLLGGAILSSEDYQSGSSVCL